MNCSYNADRHLPIIYALRASLTADNKQEIRDACNKFFIDGDTVFDSCIDSNKGLVVGQGPSANADNNNTWRAPSEVISHKPVSYFGNSDTQFSIAASAFAKKVVELTMVKFSNNGTELVDDVKNKVCENLMKYRAELVRAILDDNELNSFIEENNVKKEGEDRLVTIDELLSLDTDDSILEKVVDRAIRKSGVITREQEKAIGLLATFDYMVDNYCTFIRIKPAYKDAKGAYSQKYEWVGPNVEAANGWQDKDKDAVTQISDLSTAILNALPVLKDYKDVKAGFREGSSIGVNAFLNVITAVKTWACTFAESKNAEKLRKEAFEEMRKGMNANIAFIFDKYIEAHADMANNDIRYTPLMAELMTIKEYLFKNPITSDDAAKAKYDVLIDNFKVDFFNNMKALFTGYTETSKEDKTIKAVPLKEKLIDNAMYKLKNGISSAAWIMDSKIQTSGGAPAKGEKTTVNIRGRNYTFALDGDTYCVTTKGLDGGEKTLSFSWNSNGVVSVKDGNQLSLAELEQCMEDLCYTIITPEFKAVASSAGYDLKDPKKIKELSDIYATIIANTVSAGVWKHYPSMFSLMEVGKNTKFITGYKSTISKDTAFHKFANILSIVDGDTVKAVTKGIDKKSEVASYVMSSLMYRFSEIAADHVASQGKDGAPSSILFKSLLSGDNYNAPLYSHVEVRSGAFINGILTPPTSMSVKDLTKLAIEQDFLQNLNNDNISTIGIQDVCFADKSMQFVMRFKKSALLEKSSTAKITLGEALRAVRDDVTGKEAMTTAIIRAAYKARHERMRYLLNKLKSDFETVYGPIETTSLDDFVTFLEKNIYTKGFKQVAKDFAAAGVDFIPELHMTEKGAGFNATLYQDCKVVNADSASVDGCTSADWSANKDNRYDAFKDYLNDCRVAFYNSLKASRVKVPGLDSSNINDGVAVLAGPLEAFFEASFLLGGEARVALLGETAAHPSKQKNPEGWRTNKAFIAKDRALRISAQSKRSVIPGATMHPCMQGMLNGVAENVNIAAMKDMPSYLSNIMGKEKNMDSSDGAGLCFAPHGILENNSLGAYRAGVDRKTIGHGMNFGYYQPQLLKWAVYDTTNSRRQASFGSTASMEGLYRKLATHKSFSEVSLGDADGNINLAKLYYDRIMALGDEGAIYYEDHRTGNYYKLLAKETDGAINMYRVQVDHNGNQLGDEEHVNALCKDLYDIDQLFGGAWCMKYEDNTLKYSDDNAKMVAQFLSQKEYQAAKDCYIAYAVNISANKVGVANPNQESSWYDKKKLNTYSMSTKYYGLQMDAEHEINEDNEVSEMTQMISGLAENGYSKDILNLVYEDIGKCVVEALGTLEDAMESNEDLDRILGEALLSSMEDKSTMGLAQAFIQRAKELAEENGNVVKIPYSAQSINSAFVSTVSSLINKRGIKRKWAGFAGVQTPGYNFMEVYDGTGLFRHFNRQYLDALRSNGYDEETIKRGFSLAGKMQNGAVFIMPGLYKESKAFDEVVERLASKGVYVHTGNEATPMDPAEGGVHIYLDNAINRQYIDTEGLAYAQIAFDGDNADFNNAVFINPAPNVDASTAEGRLLAIEELTGMGWTEAASRATNLDSQSIATQAVTKIDFDYTYHYATDEGKCYTLKVKNTSDYIKLTNLMREGKITSIVRDTAVPRNLHAPKVTFEATFAEADVAALEAFNQYDLDSVRELHTWNKGLYDGLVNGLKDGTYTIANVIESIENNYYVEDDEIFQELASQALDPANEDALRTMGKLLTYTTKLLEKQVQADMRALKKGGEVYINGSRYAVQAARAGFGEGMCGRVNAAEFGLSNSVDLNDIHDEASFEAALKAERIKPTFKDNKGNQWKEAYDASMTLSNGNKVLIKLVNTAEEKNSWYNSNPTIVPNTGAYKNVNGTVYFNDTDEVFRNFDFNIESATVRDDNGQTYDVILVDDSENPEITYKALVEVISSPDAKNVYLNYNISNANFLPRLMGEKDPSRFRRRASNEPYIDIERLQEAEDNWQEDTVASEARRRYASFERAKRYIATRIPAQAMQSFMPIEMVAFTDSEVNELYLNSMKMYDDGSDFDERSTSK